jgi:soluble lytic murein transglycosylase-like protein
MPPPLSVTVALSAEESRLVREAAEALSIPTERLLANAAVAFARLCGFRKTATASVRRSPNWGPPPEPQLPEEILDVPLDPDTADQVEAAAGYVRWDGPGGVQAVTLPEYVLGAAIRLIRQTRVEGPAPSFQGLAEQLVVAVRSPTESALRASLAGLEVSPASDALPPQAVAAHPHTESALRASLASLTPSLAPNSPPLQPAGAPPTPARPAYTLPRPERPAYTLPRRERNERDALETPKTRVPRNSTGRPQGKSPKLPPTKGAREPAPGRSPNRIADRSTPSPASPSVSAGVVVWARQRPLALAATGAGLILLVVLVAAYAAATAPPETKRQQPSLPLPASPSDKGPSSAAALVLDPAPRRGETAAGALKHWEDTAPAGSDAPAATASSRKRGPTKGIDDLLNQRYGRPKVVPSPALKPEAYDADIVAAVADVVRIYPVPPALVKAVIRRESNYNPDAVSQVGAIGMMQLMPYTAKRVGLRPLDLWDAKKNILGGTRLLSALLQYYDGDVISALTAYNARPREPLAPLPKNGETPEYVAAVLRFYEEYNGAPLQQATHKDGLDAPLQPGR